MWWRTQRIQRTLLKRRDQLLSSGVARAGASAEEWDARVLTKLSERELRELASIIAAIRRLDEGTYGQCQHCESKIESGRLADDPAAISCRACASYLTVEAPLQAMAH
jgi:RNA polymerase-binding transcription factor DksA